MAAAATDLSRKRKLEQQQPSLLEQLPKVLVQHVALWLSVSETMRLRRTHSTFYAIPFSLHAPVHVSSLEPGFLARLSWQRTQVESLRIDIQFPCSDEELRSLGELRMLSGLTTLHIHVEGGSETSEKATMQHLSKTMDLALHLTSLTFRTNESDGGLELFFHCLRVNRDTLQHVYFDGALYDEEDVFPSDIISVMANLTSFSTESDVTGLSYLFSNNRVHIDKAPVTKWKYVCIADGFDIECCILPNALPDTLRGATLMAFKAQHPWVCPPKVEFLHVILADELRQLLPNHLPHPLPELACLVLTLPGKEHVRGGKQDGALFAAWVTQVSCPVLHTLSVTQVSRAEELADVLQLATRLPALRDLYITCETPDVAASLQSAYDMTRALLPSAVRLHTTDCTIELEKVFLRIHHFPLLTRHLRDMAQFEESPHNNRLIHLRPSSSHVANIQYRKQRQRIA
jgi:hypothetical protein